jgi:hypothetical protein
VRLAGPAESSDEAGAMLWNLDATLAITFKANGPSTPTVAVTGGSDMARAKLFVDYVRTSGSYLRRPSTTQTQVIWL